MTFSAEQVLMVILGLGSVISTLAVTVYRDLKAQLSECKTENATLRGEAKETVKAKDAEKDEWKRLAMQHAERQ